MVKRREALMVGEPARHLEYHRERAKVTLGSMPRFEAGVAYAIACYSAGEELEVVRNALAEAVATLASDPDPQPLPLQAAEHYYPALWALSMRMVFGDPSPVFAARMQGQDQLVDLLLKFTNQQLTPCDTLLHPGATQHLVAAIALAPASSEAIDQYLKSWYAAQGVTPWHDTHLRMDPAFFGYWAFELAAVVKALSISDAPFATNIFYPRDLVHQRLFRTWLDDGQGIADRQAKAALEAPAAIAAAKNALSAFFTAGDLTAVDGSGLERSLGLMATLLGLEPEALKQDPKLIMVALSQLFGAARGLSAEALAASEAGDLAHFKPMQEAMEAIDAQAREVVKDLDIASETVAAADAVLADPQQRKQVARTRLEAIHKGLDNLIQDNPQVGPAMVEAFERMIAEFADMLQIAKPKPLDIKSEVAQELEERLREANKKNMIGEDFDWSSLWRKE